MSEDGQNSYWHGSVLLVTKPGQKLPQLELQSMGGTLNAGASSISQQQKQLVDGLKLYADPDKTFWRFSLQVPILDVETRWKYTIPKAYFMSSVSKDKSREFVVPAATESMRIMFHSCNGFSVGTDEDFWSGKVARAAHMEDLAHICRSCALA